MGTEQNKASGKRYEIPMVVTGETIRAFGIRAEDVIWTLIGDRKCRVVMVPCTEAQYKAYMQPIWREQKRDERDGRCRIPGRDGRLVRCGKNRAACGDCLYRESVVFEENKTASLSWMAETGAEPVAEGSLEEDAVDALLFEEFTAMVAEVRARYGDIFRLLYDGQTQAQIAERLHMKPRTVSDDIRKIRAILQPVARELFDR